MSTATNTAEAVHETALAYCRALPGRMFPLPAGSKVATLEGWPVTASRDAEQVRTWFDGNHANIAWIPDPGFFVLDLDRHGDTNGFQALADLEREFGALPSTLTATTPSGGEHRYFRGPADLPYVNKAGAAGYQGIDFRVAGKGYVVAPPSATAKGTYAWKNWDDLADMPTIADAPRWLLTLACNVDPRKKVADDSDSDDDTVWDDDPSQNIDLCLDRLASALNHLDADDYDVWVTNGQRLKTIDNDRAKALWLTWSAKSIRFDEREALKKWDGFKPDRTGYRAIFNDAQGAGWKNPGRPKAQDQKSVVRAFNKKHAVVSTGGTVCILREGVSEKGGTCVNFMAKSAFQTFYENRTIPVERVNADGEIEVKRLPFASFWLKHPDRRTHEGVTFAPSGKVPGSYYNLWRGYAVTPPSLGVAAAAMRCRKFLHHVKYNLCGGSRYYFRFLLAWSADMVQDPTHKKGVAVVLRGAKGTGKSKFADMLRAILGAHAFKASKAEHIIGRFSAHLADKLLLVAEESFFAGAKADSGSLKDLITSDTVTIEPKHVGAFEMRSCHRILMCTNSEWAVPATEDERRYFVLDVGEQHMQDHDYFAAVDDEMLHRNGLEAFLCLLQKMDLSGVNLRKVPQTDALAKQKMLSLEPIDSFILDCLTDGEIVGQAWQKGANPQDDLIRDTVYTSYVAYCKDRHSRPVASKDFCPHFEKRTGAYAYQPGSGDRRRRFQLPDLDTALARFKAQLKI